MAFSVRSLGGGVRARYVDTFNVSPAPGSPDAGAAAAAVPPAPPGADMLGLPPRPKAGPGAPRPQFFVPAAVPTQDAGPPPPGEYAPPQQAYGAPPAQYGAPAYGGDGGASAPAVLAAQVDAGPPPSVGYGDMMQAPPPPPPQYSQPQQAGQWAVQGQPAQQPGDTQAQQWGELEL
jgi:hypothetical protein